MSKRVHQNLEIWKRSHQFAIGIYKLSGKFPREEVFSLTSQIRRAALSGPANITEGCAKTKTHFKNHLQIALGSLEEAGYYLIFARDMEFINESEFQLHKRECEEICKMIYSYLSKIKADS